MAVVVEAALVLIAMALGWLFGLTLQDQFPHDAAGWGWAIARGFVATIPMLAVFFWMLHTKLHSFRELNRQVRWILAQMFPDPSIGQLAMVAALAGVGEELLFRGVIQTLFIEWTLPLAGITIASVLFGAMHALSKLYFAFATAIGFCLGWMAWYYHDLLGPIIAHAVYDFVALVYLTRFEANASDRK